MRSENAEDYEIRSHDDEVLFYQHAIWELCDLIADGEISTNRAQADEELFDLKTKLQELTGKWDETTPENIRDQRDEIE
ncbi:hypothetical protein N7I30_21175 [Aurantimonas litoralis]|nr:hypothetical protein [Aurantimonas litoralis]